MSEVLAVVEEEVVVEDGETEEVVGSVAVDSVTDEIRGLCLLCADHGRCLQLGNC